MMRKSTKKGLFRFFGRLLETNTDIFLLTFKTFQNLSGKRNEQKLRSFFTIHKQTPATPCLLTNFTIFSCLPYERHRERKSDLAAQAVKRRSRAFFRTTRPQKMIGRVRATLGAIVYYKVF